MSRPHRSAPILVRVVFALPLIFLAGFSCFGFLATFEYTEWSQRLPWLAGYAVLGFGCVWAAIALLRPHGSRDSANQVDRHSLRR